MKRRRLLITGVLLLLGGAIVNVAVAWGLVYLTSQYGRVAEKATASEFEKSSSDLMRNQGDHLLIRSFAPGIDQKLWFASDAAISHDVDVNLLMQVMADRIDFLNLNGSLHLPVAIRMSTTGIYFAPGEHPGKTMLLAPTCVFRVRAGWPMRSCFGYGFGSAGSNVHHGFILREFAVGNQQDWQAFPYIPIWPGFAINTIFYAAMLWVVFFVPGMVRRRIRRRRGLCPACAYPVGTSPVCTECGAAVR